MLDVVLYGYDHCGRLTLQERTFQSHQELVRFFGSEEATPWEWAEVTLVGIDGRLRVVRYCAADLLATDDPGGPQPSPN